MAKARDVLRAIERAGWQVVRQTGSHRRLQKGPEGRTFAYHDAHELGTVQLTKVAADFGLTLDELRALLRG